MTTALKFTKVKKEDVRWAFNGNPIPLEGDTLAEMRKFANKFGGYVEVKLRSNYERDHSHTHCQSGQAGHEKHLRCCICYKEI